MHEKVRRTIESNDKYMINAIINTRGGNLQITFKLLYNSFKTYIPSKHLVHEHLVPPEAIFYCILSYVQLLCSVPLKALHPGMFFFSTKNQQKQAVNGCCYETKKIHRRHFQSREEWGTLKLSAFKSVKAMYPMNILNPPLS